MLAYLIFALTIGGIYALLALSLNLIWGGVGLVNLGLVGFSPWGLCLRYYNRGRRAHRDRLGQCHRRGGLWSALSSRWRPPGCATTIWPS
ncbi:MAG: hypothetical protein MO852_00180 [Candidatus Devosia euplotis]|nr:hypothetical protein [Candidatus Devosia euplotis]